MKTFKETKYGDLTGQTYNGDINLNRGGLTSLDGMPLIVNGDVILSNNDIKSLKGCPITITGDLSLGDNPNLKSLEYAPKSCRWLYCKDLNIPNIIEQIIQFQIKAKRYITYDGGIPLSDIKERFDDYKKMKDNIKSKGFRTLLGLDK